MCVGVVFVGVCECGVVEVSLCGVVSVVFVFGGGEREEEERDGGESPFVHCLSGLNMCVLKHTRIQT